MTSTAFAAGVATTPLLKETIGARRPRQRAGASDPFSQALIVR
jgi:hypothetical protein